MEIGGTYNSFNISSKGLSLQRKKMDIIAQNIANAESTRTENGDAYKRKSIKPIVIENSNKGTLPPQNQIRLSTTKPEHIMTVNNNMTISDKKSSDLKLEVVEDKSLGELIFMPNHPDADQSGFVESSNVNIINEMVEMIEATRNYEANLKALNASKEMIKDSLEI